MAKKRGRHQNPEPFLRDDDSKASKKRTKPPKNHQKEDKLLSSGMSAKILKEALIQQKELQDEAAEEQNPNNALLTAEEPEKDEEDIDDFAGFDETQSQFGGYDEAEIDEDDERLLESFLSKAVGPQPTLADIIAEKIKQKDAAVSSEVQPLPKLDNTIIDLYKGVGKLLRTYTAGKIPKAFRHIPAMQLWEDVLYLTEPEKWSPNAMYQATRIFASNLGVKKAERFYKLVLLPRVREDIRKNKKLHFALYQALKKSLYKPAAFNKGILFPLCESKTCNLREAVIVGSVIEKDADGLIQKKAYKVFSIILKNCDGFLSSKLEELLKLMIAVLPSRHPSAKCHRLHCLYFLIVHVSKDESEQRRGAIISSLLTEIIRALKEAEDVMGSLLKEYLNVAPKQDEISNATESNDKETKEKDVSTENVLGPEESSAHELENGKGASECSENGKQEPIHQPQKNHTTEGGNTSLQQFENVVVIVDPPRAGLHPTVIKALRTHPRLRRLVYTSCNPES